MKKSINHELTNAKIQVQSKAFIEYLNDMDVIYKNTEKYNPNKKRKTLVLFGIMLSNKRLLKLNPIVPELLIIGRKINIYLSFIVQSYFAIPKYIGLISTHYFIMKIPNKQEL